MKALVVSMALLSAAGCASQGGHSMSSDGDSVRYECYTYDYPAQHVLTLPVAASNSDAGAVTMTFHGEQLLAMYQRSGLTQLWMFEDGLYVKVDPDLSAAYMDFRGAEEGETRKPDAVFECKKRR